MDDIALVRRLENLEPPQVEATCGRAKRVVPAQLRANGAPSPPNRLLPRLGMRLVVITTCIALAAGVIFTPPGQAVTSWIGERLGFGDPGGPPTLRDLRAFATEGSAAEGQPAYVLLRGPAPEIGHYEFITYRLKAEPGKLWPATGARCFELNFPEARSIGGPRCGLPPADNGLRFDGAGGNSQPGGEYHYASGRVSADIDSVEVEFNGEPVAVELTPVPENLIERFHIRRPFKFFIAFLERARHGGTVTVTARDAGGRAIARRKSFLPDFSLIQTRICRSVKRLAEEGKLKERNARRTCRGAHGP